MRTGESAFTRVTFQFFRDLGRNNKKTWMDANRERYQLAVVQPCRRFMEELSPAILKLDPNFDLTGRTGANFSRINRDIRFAKDKTPYRPQMYVKFSVPFPGNAETGQLYVGITADTVTAGFRIYSGSKRKGSALAVIATPRILANPQWLAQQKRRLGRRYESYWYSTVKGKWTKRTGWPTSQDWPKLQAWIVRKKLPPAAAMRANFVAECSRLFRDLYPILHFSSLAD